MKTTPKMVSEPKTSITIATGVGLPVRTSPGNVRIRSKALLVMMPSPPSTMAMVASASAHAAPVTFGAVGASAEVCGLSNKLVPHCLQYRKPWLYGAAQLGQYMKPPHCRFVIDGHRRATA